METNLTFNKVDNLINFTFFFFFSNHITRVHAKTNSFQAAPVHTFTNCLGDTF